MRLAAWLRRWRNIQLMKPVSEECGAPSHRVLPVDLSRFLTREHHRIHLVGVAGSGMSGIAALLLELRHEVSGSDKVSTVETVRLQRLGLRFHQQHRAEDARDAQLVVFSSAIKINNPILVSARDSEKPVARRAEALAAIMHDKRAVLIAGMHGKTTTSAMAAHVLREAGSIPHITSAPKFPFLGTTRIGTRVANTSSRRATKAMGRCAAFIPSALSF